MIDELLDDAATSPLHSCIATIRNFEAFTDADGTHRDHEIANASRRLRMWLRRDGLGELFGQFGAGDYAGISEMLARDTDGDGDDDLAEFSLGGDGTPLARTPDQRRADALLQIAAGRRCRQRGPSAGARASRELCGHPVADR